MGRTGTLIAIYCMLKMIEDVSEVDVFNFVLKMRAQRTYMVQTEVGGAGRGWRVQLHLQTLALVTHTLTYPTAPPLLPHPSCPTPCYPTPSCPTPAAPPLLPHPFLPLPCYPTPPAPPLLPHPCYPTPATPPLLPHPCCPTPATPPLLPHPLLPHPSCPTPCCPTETIRVHPRRPVGVPQYQRT